MTARGRVIGGMKPQSVRAAPRLDARPVVAKAGGYTHRATRVIGPGTLGGDHNLRPDREPPGVKFTNGSGFPVSFMHLG